MQDLINYLNNFLSGPIIVWGIVIVGIILSIKTNFIQVRKLGASIKQTLYALFKKTDNTVGITPFQAVTTALAGTIGTGNIVGVAAAISIGGAGAIFWMWISAFLGMATKYAEIVLAIRYREKNGNEYIGGPMYYLREICKSKFPSIAFAILCILSSFGIGNMVQSNAISGAITSVSTMNFRPIMIVISIIVGFVIIGGIKRIAKITESFIPFMAVFYMLGCIIIIFMNFDVLGLAFLEIFTGAFDFSSVAGGIMGFLTAKSLRVGFARGVFTNEAGLGSAPIAHAAANAKSPADQGLMGIFEVFFDTIVMCTLTGLVIIISGLYCNPSLDGASLTLSAFTMYLGKYAGIFIAISTIFFAVSSIISWSYYGESCIKFLCKSKYAILIYKIIFVGAIYFGAVTSLDFVWGIADLFNSLMMIPNLIGIILLSNEVKRETKLVFH